MRIYFSTSPLLSGHSHRGIGTYTRELLAALKASPQLTVFEFSGLIPPNKPDATTPSLVHYPFFDIFGSSLPRSFDRPTVVTVHDLIPIKYPLQYPPGIRGKLKWLSQKSKLKQVNAIITDSQAGRVDIIKQIKPSYVTTIPLGVAPEFKPASSKPARPTRLKLPRSFVLYVGDANYNKNLPLLMDVCRSRRVHLVLVGGQFTNHDIDRHHPWNSDLVRAQDASENNKYIHAVGRVSDTELVTLYQSARLYIAASFDEGFGLPVLEAMACGCPVLASDIGAHREIGSDTIEYFNPHSREELGYKLTKMLRRRQLINFQGVKRAKLFTWRKTAQNTINVYEQTLSR